MDRLTRIGHLPHSNSRDVKFSRMGIGFEKLDRDAFDPKEAYDKLAELGVKKVRLQSGWLRTERVKGVYDFAWLDEVVDSLIERGMEPWINLAYGNPIYTELAKEFFGGVGCPPINSEEEMQGWLGYVSALVKHFHGRVFLYEIWNEPDGKCWRHEGYVKDGPKDLESDAREYAEFAKRTSMAIKAVDSSIGVAGPALANTYQLYYPNMVLANGLGDYIDYFTYHYYAKDDLTRANTYRKMRNILNLYCPHVKLIQGETGSQSDPRGCGAMGKFAWTPERHAKHLVRTLVTDIHLGVEFASYFSAIDMAEALDASNDDLESRLDFGYFGVLSADYNKEGKAIGNYKEKPAYYALQTISYLLQGDARACDMPVAREYLPSKRLSGDDCWEDDVQMRDFRLDNGDTMLTYWRAVPILSTTYEGTISLAVYGQDVSNIRLADLTTGELYRMPADMVRMLPAGGVEFINMPLRDTPMAILFGSNTPTI